jgi:short subunit dehydrogenase-like uncharacterized protein
MSDRDFDIVLLGATGFTGRLIAAYLAEAAPPTARLGLAGRSEAKLAEVAAGLGREVGLVVVDATDPVGLRRLADSTRVLMTTGGPYVAHGDPVVGACAAAGTDYLDLCGESEFVDETYLRHHATAVGSGARLVHACGFDSIPHDLGAQFTVEQLGAGPDQAVEVRGHVRMAGTFSGGTFASALGAMSRMRQASSARARRLALEGSPEGRTITVGSPRVSRSSDTGRWALPMPTVDPQIVADSARRIPAYGRSFTYTHLLDAESGLGMAGLVAGVGAVAGLAQIPPARRALSRRVPQGTGPSEEKRAAAWFRVRFFGESAGRRVVTEVSGGDPGYTETAKMMSESALCLAFDELAPTAGQVTTAVAMGPALRQRLDAAGIRFRVLPADIGGADAP